MLDNFLLTIFYKYAELLQKKFSDDFQEVVSMDDYMPMTVSSPEEYEEIVNVSWFPQDRPKVASFPVTFPFSKLYPVCCIDIRDFLNQFYVFTDGHFQHPGIIDETLRKVCDYDYGHCAT
jgi:hypothetical protein